MDCVTGGKESTGNYPPIPIQGFWKQPLGTICKLELVQDT